jgi:hypothetical protein
MSPETARPSARLQQSGQLQVYADAIGTFESVVLPVPS